MGESKKSLAEIKVDDIHSFINPYCHAISCQAKFPLSKSMLTTPNDLLFYMCGSDLQNDLYHQLSKDGGHTDWWVSQALLFSLFEQGNKILFPPVIKHFSSCSPLFFKDDEQWLSNICQLPQTHECIPSGPKDLWMLNLPSLFLTTKKSSLLQPSSLSFHTCDSWRPASAAKTEANKSLSNYSVSLSSITRVWKPPWLSGVKMHIAVSYPTFHPQVSPSPPWQGAFQSVHPPNCIDIRDCLNLSARPCSWCCWNFWD